MKILVYGYGNPGREDDGLGIRFAEIIETWDLQNAWVKEINFGTLDYGTEDPLDVELTIKYDWCTYTPGQLQGNTEPLWDQVTT